MCCFNIVGNVWRNRGYRRKTYTLARNSFRDELMSNEQGRVANNVALLRQLRDGDALCSAGARACRRADHLTVLFSKKVPAVRRGNDIYRPAGRRLFILLRIQLIQLVLHCVQSWQPLLHYLDYLCELRY